MSPVRLVCLYCLYSLAGLSLSHVRTTAKSHDMVTSISNAHVVSVLVADTVNLSYQVITMRGQPVMEGHIVTNYTSIVPDC